LPWKLVPEGLVVTVRLTPKGRRDAIDGIEQLGDGATVLKARVRAAASDGEANAALVRLMANALQVAPGRVTLVAGGRARIKRLLVEGDGAALSSSIERFVRDDGDDRKNH
jgi:uncharacterized protein YggU (UPF0235/DUF167 family)